MFNFNTNPLLNDTDSDGLLDGTEVLNYSTNPLNDDSDSDGLLDGMEVNHYNTNPLLDDMESDGIPDGWEIQAHLVEGKIEIKKYVDSDSGDCGLKTKELYCEGGNQ